MGVNSDLSQVAADSPPEAEADLLELKTPMLQQLHRDWELRRRGRAMPSRADFDVLDLKYCIGNLSLIEVAGDPPRFRFLIHATNVAQGMGFDLTGKSLDLLPDAHYRRLVEEHFAEALATRRPVARYRNRQMTDQHIWNCEVLVLPLSTDGKTIDMLFSGFVWF
jgi:hypothetical protein